MKPQWKLIGVSTDGWYHFSNLRSPDGIRREGYMIHRDNFWNFPSRCWDCGQRGGRHGNGCMYESPLACWEKQLLAEEPAPFLCALPQGHGGPCERESGDGAAA